MTAQADEHQRTLAFAEIALGQIKALRQPAYPRNYEVWYAYATGYNPSLNQTINETLSRTLMTSVTVFVAVAALVIFGGPVLYSFSIAMLWGVIVGTYSSIWIACAGLVFMKLRPEQLRHEDDEAAKAKV